jgi:hypothetical protein
MFLLKFFEVWDFHNAFDKDYSRLGYDTVFTGDFILEKGSRKTPLKSNKLQIRAES